MVAVVTGSRGCGASRQRSGGMQTARMHTVARRLRRRRGAGSDISQGAGLSHMVNWSDGNDHVAVLLSQHELHPVAYSKQLVLQEGFATGAPCPPPHVHRNLAPRLQSLIMQRHAGQTRYDRGKRRGRRASAPCPPVQPAGL
jgi:hypothetical protein